MAVIRAKIWRLEKDVSPSFSTKAIESNGGIKNISLVNNLRFFGLDRGEIGIFNILEPHDAKEI